MAGLIQPIPIDASSDLGQVISRAVCAHEEASSLAELEAFFAPYATHFRDRLTRIMHEFTAIIEPAPEGGFWAICPEIPGANGQGETLEETKESLRQAIEMILDDHRTSDIPVAFLRDRLYENYFVD